MSNIASDDDQRNDQNFETEDGSNPISRGRKFYYLFILEFIYVKKLCFTSKCKVNESQTH